MEYVGQMVESERTKEKIIYACIHCGPEDLCDLGLVFNKFVTGLKVKVSSPDL